MVIAQPATSPRLYVRGNPCVHTSRTVRWRRSWSHSTDAIIGKSLDGIIQTWNDAAERVFGYAAHEAVGRHISLVIPPDRIAEEDQIITTLRAGQPIDHFETERVRKDGRRILVSLTRLADKRRRGQHRGLFQGRPRHHPPAAGRRARAAAAGRSGRRQRQVPGVLRAGRVARGHHGAGRHHRRGQPAVLGGLRLHGGSRSSASASGKVPGGRLRPRCAQQIKAASAQAIAGSTFRGETPYFVADGSERTADITIVPIKDEAGKVLFVAPTGIDITDRKRAEAERREVRDARREQQRLHRHVRSAGRPLLHQPRRAGDGGPRRPRAGAPGAGGGVLLPGGSAQDHGRVLPLGARAGPRRDRHPLPALQDRRSALDGVQGADAAGRRRPTDGASRRSARTSPSGGGWDDLRLAADLSEAEPPQERVPRDAGARAAKPARADQQRRARPARRTRRREGGARGARRCSNVRWASWRVWSTICST